MDSSSYALRKGNVVTSYSVTVSPGISTDQAAPGTKVTTINNSATFRYNDVLKPTSTITYPVKVASIGGLPIGTVSGTFAIGNTITGATTGKTATVYKVDSNSLTVNIPTLSTSATSVTVSSVTGLAANDYIAINNSEIVRLNSLTGYNLTITRAQLGTAAATIAPGAPAVAVRTTATTTTINEGATFSASDTTLTVTSAASFSTGDYIKIDNEFLLIVGILNNDLTVTRGQLGTAAATHTNGATVTRCTTVLTFYANFFGLTEQIGNGSGATANVNISIIGFQSAFSGSNKFVYDFGSGGFEYVTAIPVDADRIYRFTQSDSSNTGFQFLFSLSPDGTNGPSGLEYTTGVTKNGTAGSNGAYTQINLSPSNIGLTTTIYSYAAGNAALSGNGSLNIDTTPNYTTIYLYEIDGALSVTDTFTLNSVTYTITGIRPGPYGYVMQDKSGSAIKVGLGNNSISFATYTTTVSAGTTGQFTFTVASATNLVIGMAASGTGIGTGAIITNIVGTTVTVDVANSGTVSGTGTFNFTFYDSPRTTAALRALATVSSFTDISTEDYIFYDKAISGNTTDKNSGIVIGPGQSLLVYSGANTISYSLIGFEDTTTDFTVNRYIRNSAAV